MVALAVKPLVLKDVLLQLDTLDFAKHVEQVEFTPKADTVTWTGLGGNTHTDVSTATWTATLGYVQDWESAESLSQYLFENEGQTVAATFKPKSGTGPSFTVDLIITPGSIGGKVSAYAVTTVTLGCAARPSLVPAP